MFEAGASPEVGPAKPTGCERAAKKANAVVCISTAADPIFEFEDKIVVPAKIAFRAAAAHLR
jgi:hypothetical protein